MSVKWAYRLATLESITNCMEENSIAQLADRRKELDEKFIKKIELGLYDVNINDYVSFNNSSFYTPRRYQPPLFGWTNSSTLFIIE